jgi:hypothetical protein
MTRENSKKVIVWRPFPSPTQRSTEPLPAVPVVLNAYQRNNSREESSSAKDDAAISRWVELADILNGNKKARKKGSAA